MVKGKNRNMCIFDVKAIDNKINPPTVTLGLGFLRSYDVILDAENKQIGLYNLDPGMIEDHIAHGLSLEWDIAIGLFTVILIASTVFLCVCCY
jgi:hypothetical protein